MMKNVYRLLALTLLSLTVLTCTENSLFNDKIDSTNNRTITGHVYLSGETDHGNISVYLEGFNIETRTEMDGRFEINIPGNASSQPISGAYKMYFYLDNYSLESANILAVDGQLEYGHADLDTDGRLSKNVDLKKLLDISITLSPDTVNTNFTGSVIASMRLDAGVDTIDVRTVQAKPHQFAGVFLKNITNPEDIRILKTSSRLVDTQVSGSQKWEMIIPWGAVTLPIGTYEVIPFIKVIHANFPAVLDVVFGVNSGNFTTDFLNIPQRRTTTRLYVQDFQ